MPWIEVPNISEADGAFDEGRDPYAAYAGAVLAALEADVNGDVVVARADFVANVRAWRANSAALEIALRDRMGVSVAETNAFLKAQNRITGFVRRYMDASDWFVDTPVPADLRLYVDTVFKPRFDALADQMKDSLNQWTGDGLDLEQTQLYQTISAFAGAMSTIGEGFEAYGEMMQTLVHATTCIGVGFVPVVGPVLDLCEAVTGKEWCLPAGRAPSDEERILSGLGVAAAAIGPFWRGIQRASVSAPSTRVAAKIVDRDDVFGRGFRASLQYGYKGLEGAITTKPVNPCEKAATKFLIRDGRGLLGLGDDGVRVVLWHKLSGEARAKLSAPDFLTVSARNKLILSEAKGGRNVDGDEVIEQLSSGMEGVRQRGLVADVEEEVELLMEQGGKFGDRKYIEKDGYLFDKDRGKRATLKGFNRPIKVIRL